MNAVPTTARDDSAVGMVTSSLMHGVSLESSQSVSEEQLKSQSRALAPKLVVFSGGTAFNSVAGDPECCVTRP